MPIKLPAELKTNKVDTLPDDLRFIAEEMLAKKFDIPEEVPPKRGGSFRVQPVESAWTTAGTQQTYYGVEFEPSYGRGGRQSGNGIKVRLEPWSGHRVAEISVREPTIDSLMRAIRTFDEEMIDGDRTFIMSPRFWHYLARDPNNFRYIRKLHKPRFQEGVKPVIAELLGCDVIVYNPMEHCVLEGKF